SHNRIHLTLHDSLPICMVAGMDATEQQVQVVREQLGLDKPILTQYVDYMKGLFTGDLGDSIKNGANVADTIGSRFGATITLTFRDRKSTRLNSSHVSIS